MRTVRRVYVYLVALVSLEVIVWGLIGAARTAIDLSRSIGKSSDLSSPLALVLVGLPVFLLHWGMAQRSAARDIEERICRPRGFFFYGALAGLLIPVVQNGMAIVNRLLLALLNLPPARALMGGQQKIWDNLSVILISGLAAFLLINILRRDRRFPETLPGLNEVRRLYRVVWLLYGLGLTIAGVQMVISYILTTKSGMINVNEAQLGNALTLLIGGLPIWLVTWSAMQSALDQPEERNSVLRWIVLYILSIAGVGTVLATTGFVLAELFHKMLGGSLSWTQLLNNIRMPLSIAVPLGGVWAYYGSILHRQIAEVNEVNRRAALLRLYYYILSMLGLGTVIAGMILLCNYLVGVLVRTPMLKIPQSNELADAGAVLAVGLPLWLVTWRPMVMESMLEGDEGDHARRSSIRKTYLYLGLFAGVIGSMVSAWQTLSPLFNAWFGNPPSSLAAEVYTNLSHLAIFLVLLAYHLSALRSDGRIAAHALALRHSQFNVLVIGVDNEFLLAVETALKRHAPNIPVTGLALDQGAIALDPQSYQAVVLTGSLAVNPPEELRSWLNTFKGETLVLPKNSDDLAWVGSHERSAEEWAEQTAQAVRQRAEGLPLRTTPPARGWVLAGYIFSALFIVETLLLVLLLVSLVFNR